MQPLPFQVPQNLMPKPKKTRSTVLTAILGLRAAIDALIVVAGVIGYVALGSQSNVTVPREQAQHAANVLLVGVVVSFVELFGIFGTFSFKRWGVYVVLGFSALNIMSNLSAGNRFFAMGALITSLIIGAAIYPRWKDYE